MKINQQSFPKTYLTSQNSCTTINLMKKLLLIFLVLFIFLDQNSSKAQQPGQYQITIDKKTVITLKDWSDESQEVTLEGKIVLYDFYGPPGYGENPEEDMKVSYYFLVPKNPIKFEVDGETKIIKEVQIVTAKGTKYTVNKNYKIKGKLFLPSSGFHFGELLIAVSE